MAFWTEKCHSCPAASAAIKKSAENYLLVCSEGHRIRFCQTCWTSKKVVKAAHGATKQRRKCDFMKLRASCPVSCRGRLMECHCFRDGKEDHTVFGERSSPKALDGVAPDILEQAKTLFYEEGDEIMSVVSKMRRERGRGKSLGNLTSLAHLKKLNANTRKLILARLEESWNALNDHNKNKWIGQAEAASDAKAQQVAQSSNTSAKSREKISTKSKSPNFTAAKGRRSSQQSQPKFGRRASDPWTDYTDENQGVSEVTLLQFAPPPRGQPVARQAAKPKKAPPQVQPNDKKAFPSLKPAPARPRPVVPAPAPMKKNQRIPNPDFDKWATAKCPETGDEYYYHLETQEVSWEAPARFLDPPAGARGPPNQGKPKVSVAAVARQPVAAVQKQQPAQKQPVAKPVRQQEEVKDQGGSGLKKARPALAIVMDIEQKAPALRKTKLLGEIRRSIIDLEQEHAEAQRKCRRKKEDLEELQAVQETHEQEKEQFEKTKHKLDMEAATLRQDLLTLERDIDLYREDRDDACKKLERREGDIVYYRNENVRLRDEVNSLRAELDRLRGRGPPPARHPERGGEDYHYRAPPPERRAPGYQAYAPAAGDPRGPAPPPRAPGGEGADWRAPGPRRPPANPAPGPRKPAAAGPPPPAAPGGQQQARPRDAVPGGQQQARPRDDGWNDAPAQRQAQQSGWADPAIEKRGPAAGNAPAKDGGDAAGGWGDPKEQGQGENKGAADPWAQSAKNPWDDWN